MAHRAWLTTGNRTAGKLACIHPAQDTYLGLPPIRSVQFETGNAARLTAGSLLRLSRPQIVYLWSYKWLRQSKLNVPPSCRLLVGETLWRQIDSVPAEHIRVALWLLQGGPSKKTGPNLWAGRH